MVSLKFLKKSSSGSSKDQKLLNPRVVTADADADADAGAGTGTGAGTGPATAALTASPRPISAHNSSDNTSTVTITDLSPLLVSCPALLSSPSPPFHDASSSPQTLPAQAVFSPNPCRNPSIIFERTVQDQPCFSRRNSLLQTSENNHRTCCPNHTKSTPNSPAFDSFSFDSKPHPHTLKQVIGSSSTSSCCCSPKLSAASMSSPRLNATASMSSSGLNALDSLSSPSSPPLDLQSESHNYISTPPLQNRKNASVSPSLSPTSFCSAIPAHYILDDYVAPSLDTAVTLQPSFKDQAPRTRSNHQQPSFSSASDNERTSANFCPTAYVSAISRKPSIIEMSLNNYLDRTLSQALPPQLDYSNKNGFIAAHNNFSLSTDNQENSTNHGSSAASARLETSVDPLTPCSLSSPLPDPNSNSPSLSPEASSTNICLGTLIHRRASLYSLLSPYKQSQSLANNNETSPQPVLSNMALSDSQDACFCSYADLLNDEISSQ